MSRKNSITTALDTIKCLMYNESEGSEKMNLKKYIAVLTASAFVFAPSCADVKNKPQTDTTVDFNEFLPKTEKIEFSSGDCENTVLGNDTYAVRFSSEKELYSFELSAFSESKKGSVRLTLYKCKNDYQTTVSEEKYAEYLLSPLLPKEEKITPFIVFALSDRLVAGDYLAVLSSNGTDAGIMIGKKTDDTNGGIVCYKNGVEFDKAPCAIVEFK